MRMQHVDGTAAKAASTGLLVGLLAGAAVALLLAPYDGRTTRRLIRRKARHGRRRAQQALVDTREAITRGQQRVTEAAAAGANQLSRAGGRLVEAARHGTRRTGS